MKGKKIVITNIYGRFGGTLVLAVLCRELRRLGYDASLLMLDGNHLSDKNVKKSRIGLWLFQVNALVRASIFKHFHRFKFGRMDRFAHFACFQAVEGCHYKLISSVDLKEDLILYPDIVMGNPLKAEHVVRWLLYHNRYKDQDDAYSKDDLFIAFRTVFNDPDLNPENNRVTMNFFNKSLYRQYNFGEREGNCYILRKGRDRKDLPEHFDGPVFDDDMTDEEVVAMFNKCKYCYSYDTQTFYNTIAAVCGCISIVVMEEGKTMEDYLGESERAHYGRAYGDTKEQIEYAIATRDKLLQSLDYDERNRKNALELVRIVEKRFGPIARL